MRKKTGSIFKYTFVFLFCISATAFSQNITLDSLLNVLRSEQDNKRINTLLEISYKYSEVGKTQQEYLYAKQALDLSKKLKWPKGEISAMCQMAFSLQSQGYYDSADVIARKVMLLSDELKDPGGLACAHRIIAENCISGNRNKEALSHLLLAMKGYATIADQESFSYTLSLMEDVLKAEANITGAKKVYGIAISFCRASGYKTGEADHMNKLGLLEETLGNYTASRAWHLKALELYKATNHKLGLADVYTNLGISAKDQGNYPDAIHYYLEGLKVREELKDSIKIAQSYNNIGVIYNDMGRYDESLGYFLKSFEIKKRIGEKHDMAIGYANIADVYRKLKKYDLSLQYNEQALQLFEEEGFKFGIAVVLANQGELYAVSSEYTQAIEKYKAALLLFQEIESAEFISSINCSMGELFFKQKQYAKARDHYIKAYDIALVQGNKLGLRTSCKGLSALDSISGDYRSEWYHYNKYILYSDSLSNEADTKLMVQQEMQYEFGKMQAADSLKVADERRVNEVKFEQEKKQRYYLYAGLGLVAVFAGFMFNRFKVTQKQKRLIEIKEQEARHQKAVVEEKQKEILDSIRYAKRIQKSLLPTEKYIDRKIKELKK